MVSQGWTVSKQSGWDPDGFEMGLDHSQSVQNSSDCFKSIQTALKQAGGFKLVLNIYTHCVEIASRWITYYSIDSLQ